MAGLITRPAQPSDYDRMMTLYDEQRALEMQLDPRLQAVAQRAVFDMGHILPDGYVAVAVRDGLVVGFVYAMMVDQTVIIEGLVVDAHQGQGGVGSVLLDAVVRWAGENGAVALIAENVPSGVAVQQAFWRSKGGQVVQETYMLRLQDRE